MPSPLSYTEELVQPDERMTIRHFLSQSPKKSRNPNGLIGFVH